MLATMVLLSEVYMAHGWHGGYYITDTPAYAALLDELFSLLEARPEYKAVMELEPYTLEAMLHGERFEVEKRGREVPVILGWDWVKARGKVSPLREASREGQYGARLELREGVDWINLCQPQPARGLWGRELTFSGWVRAHKGKGAHLYIDAWDDYSYISGSSRLSKFVPPDGRWHFVEVEFVVPDGARALFPQAKIVGEPGVADFDELSLKDAATGKELLKNGGFEEVKLFPLKDPERLSQLRRWIEKGRLEVVGGAYSQPILYTIGEEAVVREFLLGTRAVEEALGVPVEVYAAQEPNWVGQIPQILKGFGFRAALYRTDWGAFGAAPPKDAEVVWWEGPDGTRIVCLPHLSPIRLPWGTSLPNRRAVEECKKLGIKRPLFSFLADFVPTWFLAPDSPEARGIFEVSWANVCLGLDAKPLRGKTIVFSGWIRARKPGAHIYIDAHGREGLIEGTSKRSPNISPDGKWHRVEIRLKVPNNALYLYPQGKIIAEEGDADFDGFSVRIGGEEREFLPNPSFEEGLSGGWSFGSDQGVKVEGEVMEGEAAEGRRFVRLRMRSLIVQARQVTIKEYLDLVGEPKEVWHDAYQGFVHRFPFGILAGKQQRANKKAEDAILRTERLYAISGKEPGKEIWEAWRLLLISHHHDAWVCAPVIFGMWVHGFTQYAELSYAACDEALRICEKLTKALEGKDPRKLSLVNVCSFERKEFINVKLTLPQGLIREPALKGPEGRLLPSLVEVKDLHPDGTAKEAEIWALCHLPPMGYVKAEVVEGRPPKPPKRAKAKGVKAKGKGAVFLENEFVKVEVGKDGVHVFSSDGKPLTRGPVFVAGRFKEGDRVWEVSKVEAETEGPFAVAKGEGRIGPNPLTFEVRLSPLSPLLRLSIDFDFGKEKVVGEGEPLPPGQIRPEVPTWARDDLKLRFCLPLTFREPEFLAHNAFELRRPHDLRFPILRFALAREGRKVVTVYTDRQTAGVFREGPEPSLEVVLAYGGSFYYAPEGFAPLRGRERYELALFFGEGDLESLRVAQVAEELAQPVLALKASDAFPDRKFSLLSVEPEIGAVLSAAFLEGGRLHIRLWRPYEGERKLTLKLTEAKEIRPSDMRGKPVGGPLGPGGDMATLRVRKAQIVNLTARRF